MSAIKHKYFPEMTTFSQVKLRIPKRTNICLLFSRISILNIVTFNVLSVILGGFGFQNTFFVLVHPCLGQQSLAAFLFPSLLPRNVFLFSRFPITFVHSSVHTVIRSKFFQIIFHSSVRFLLRFTHSLTCRIVPSIFTCFKIRTDSYVGQQNRTYVLALMLFATVTKVSAWLENTNNR